MTPLTEQLRELGPPRRIQVSPIAGRTEDDPLWEPILAVIEAAEAQAAILGDDTLVTLAEAIIDLERAAKQV